MVSKSLKSLKASTRENPQIATIRVLVFAIVVAVIVNTLSGGQSRRSGLFLVLVLVILNIIKSKKK